MKGLNFARFLTNFRNNNLLRQPLLFLNYISLVVIVRIMILTIYRLFHHFFFVLFEALPETLECFYRGRVGNLFGPKGVCRCGGRHRQRHSGAKK